MWLTGNFCLFFVYPRIHSQKSKYLLEELKGKSSFAQQKPLLNGSNPRPENDKKIYRIKLNPSE